MPVRSLFAPLARRVRRSVAAWLLLTLPLVAFLTAARPARAEFVPQYFFFDRVLWSADSRQVLLVGRYTNDNTHETFEDTLLVDVGGRITSASPSMYEFTLSRDRRRIVGRGRWGLYDYELATARTKELLYQAPFDPNELVTFGYNKDVNAVVAIRCNSSDPDTSGVWSYPLAGGPPTKLFADPYCGPQSLNFWQLHRREVAPTEPNVPTGDRPTEIPGTGAQVIQTDEKGRNGVLLRQAGRDTVLCHNCRAEYVSWPPAGGVALVATAPENRLNVVGPGALWLVRAGQPVVRLRDGRSDRAAWSDSATAYCTLRPGRLLVVDTGRPRVDEMNMSAVPPWGRGAMPAPARVWTIATGEGTWPDFETVRAEALRYREAAGATGFAADPLAGGPGFRLSVGAWPDSQSAARQLAAVRKARAAGAATGVAGECRVYARPAASMAGYFDFGSRVSPDGKWRLFFKSHPHMFLPYLADEVWLEPTAGGRRHLLVPAMASF